MISGRQYNYDLTNHAEVLKDLPETVWFCYMGRLRVLLTVELSSVPLFYGEARRTSTVGISRRVPGLLPEGYGVERFNKPAAVKVRPSPAILMSHNFFEGKA